MGTGYHQGMPMRQSRPDPPSEEATWTGARRHSSDGESCSIARHAANSSNSLAAAPAAGADFQPRIRPTCRTSQRVFAKNRWAREWCHTPAKPAPVNIPDTVRSTGRRMKPVNIAVNTSYPAAEKLDRKCCSRVDRESGTLTLAGIGGTCLLYTSPSPRDGLL